LVKKIKGLTTGANAFYYAYGNSKTTLSTYGGAENTTVEISGALINLWANFHTDD
jgi:hypothetical protein